MRSVVAALVPFVWMGSTAGLAQQAPAPALSGQAAAGVVGTHASTSAPVKATKRGRNGRLPRVAVADKRQERPRGPSTVEEALSTCLVLWEPATHMTKREWTRACRRVAERLRDTG
jgi:hypothetical protein